MSADKEQLQRILIRQTLEMEVKFLERVVPVLSNGLIELQQTKSASVGSAAELEWIFSSDVV